MHLTWTVVHINDSAAGTYLLSAVQMDFHYIDIP